MHAIIDARSGERKNGSCVLIVDVPAMMLNAGGRMPSLSVSVAEICGSWSSNRNARLKLPAGSATRCGVVHVVSTDAGSQAGAYCFVFGVVPLSIVAS